MQLAEQTTTHSPSESKQQQHLAAINHPSLNCNTTHLANGGINNGDSELISQMTTAGASCAAGGGDEIIDVYLRDELVAQPLCLFVLN
jgi:hypothetical protein